MFLKLRVLLNENITPEPRYEVQVKISRCTVSLSAPALVIKHWDYLVSSAFRLPSTSYDGRSFFEFLFTLVLSLVFRVTARRSTPGNLSNVKLKNHANHIITNHSFPSVHESLVFIWTWCEKTKIFWISTCWKRSVSSSGKRTLLGGSWTTFILFSFE
jgi:hypothetical protein